MPRRDRTPQSDADDLRERIRINEGIDLALRRWPEVSALVFETETSSSLVEELVILLDIDTDQACAVADMQVRRIGRLERGRVAQQLAELRLALTEIENRPPQ